jgi:hypothetical protein
MSERPTSERPVFDRLKRQLGLIAVLGLLYLGGLYLRRDTGETPSDPGTTPGPWTADARGLPVDREAEQALLAALAAKPLVLTRHGRCRMDCREIDLAEVRGILQSGRLNRSKSEPQDQPCPAWALEGRTDDGQRVRIVYSGCDTETRVITAIDLENEYACSCD